MHGVVKRGAHEVVHGGIHYHKIFAAVLLGVEDAHQQHARGRDMERPGSSSRWQPSGRTMAATAFAYSLGSRRLLAPVAHAEAAAEIEITQVDAGLAEIANVAAPGVPARGGMARGSESASQCAR